MVPEVLPATARALCELAPAGQGPVRERLPGHQAGPLAGRLRQARDQGNRAAEDPEGQRCAPARVVVTPNSSRSAPNTEEPAHRSEEHTSELPSLMRISSAVF